MTYRTLVVDDSLTVRMDLADAFAEAGLEVETADTLAAARAALKARDFGLVVLDILLPDGDGVDLLAELRADHAHESTAVMLLSTEAEVGDRIRGLRTGADEYVGKPYELTYVVGRARELLRLRNVESSPQATVLLIDDSVTFREALRSALEGASYRVVTAGTGEDGLRVAATERPHAVVVDGLLPGIDGATVIRRMRLDTVLRRSACILLTGSEQGENAEVRALDAGADAFVRKEEDIDVILARIGAALRSASAEAVDPDLKSLLGPKKILAVDDSPTYLDELASALRVDGYEVVCARSGEEALDLLPFQPVDCILLDLVMPGLGGTETCRRIKAAPGLRDIPLIVLTSLEQREAMIDGLGAGADDFISKSNEMAIVRARVLAQIRRKHYEDENRRMREQLLRGEIEAAEARAARELAQTRAALVEELERKNRELEAFSYSVSHDLRAPLRSIDGFSRLLLEDHSATLDAEAKGHLTRVCDAAKRMSELIDALLQLSRVGRAELRREDVDLTELAESVASDHRKANPGREVEVVVEPGLTATGDGRLLRAVLDNLLGNAWKFTAKTANARIEVGAKHGDGPPLFFVRDNGAGFDMKHAAKLFSPFQRLHSEREFGGTGIGLATVARIVDRHGGRVWAEGEPGRGATMFFTLAPRV